MSATLAQVRAGLQARLATVAGLNALTLWPVQINTPAALIKPFAMSERTSMGGWREKTFEVTLLAAPATTPMDTAQVKLDAFLDESGSSSLIAALEADSSLGGIVSGLTVTWADYNTLEVNGIEFYGAKFTVQVFA